MPRRTAALVVGAIVLTRLASGSEKKVRMSDLPAAVQKAVQEQTKDAELRGLTKEMDHGQTVYEAETVANGRTRDVLFDATGHIVAVEEEVDLATLPTAARSALEASGTVLGVESISKDGVVNYEAQVKKGRKKFEVVVDAQGRATKN